MADARIAVVQGMVGSGHGDRMRKASSARMIFSGRDMTKHVLRHDESVPDSLGTSYFRSSHATRGSPLAKVAFSLMYGAESIIIGLDRLYGPLQKRYERAPYSQTYIQTHKVCKQTCERPYSQRI